MIMRIDRRVVRAGLIGASIASSRTPAMHRSEGAALGLDYRYETFDLDLVPGGVAALPALLDRLEAAGFRGVNVTHPCKQQVIAQLSDLSLDARAIGAVNSADRVGDSPHTACA